MKNILLSTALLGLGLSSFTPARGCGYEGPHIYLDQGGQSLVATPEFFWDLEVKRLARDFHPTEKPMVVHRIFDNDGLVDHAPMIKATADADLADFTDALRTGAIKPPDATKATQQHTDARNAVAKPAAGPLGDEFDSEFADYHRGAYAYNLGPDHYAEAKKAWLALLNRPATERHYRTLWATFMLGKMALAANDPEASKWFEQTRDLAKQGFADSLGMAADSYGWEGRSEWLQGHSEKAAPLYLTQLALGDESAVVSLRNAIYPRPPVSNPDAPISDAAMEASLKASVTDPLLRRLVTANILASGLGRDLPGSKPEAAKANAQRWLKIVHEARLSKVEDAEYLGWIAYSTGDYAQAQHWLDLAAPDSPAGGWLRAKLQLRAGNLTAATKSLAAVLNTLRSQEKYTYGWSGGAFAMPPNVYGPSYIPRVGYEWDETWDMDVAAVGDLGLMHLQRGDFAQALDLFLQADLPVDAAFIAERVMTADELKAFVDKMPPPPATQANTETEDATFGANNPTRWMRNLLGRRLVREERYADAAKYLAAPYDRYALLYADALKQASNKNLPKKQRAKAYFTAAWLARNEGMALMGAEFYPDSFYTGGDYGETDIARQQLSGTYTVVDYSNGKKTSQTFKNPVQPSRKEVARLKATEVDPDKRYHYRYLAASLAMRAAALLPDQSEELADVVNSAGNWVKNTDEKLGDRYFQVIDRRCAKTKLGGEASAKHWFVEETGPWSGQLVNGYNTLLLDDATKANGT